METAGPAMKLRSARGWLAGAILASAATAWVAVAAVPARAVEYSGHMGVAGIALTIGGLEAAYLAWRAWTLGKRVHAYVVTGAASAGALLVFVAVIAGVTATSMPLVAAGIGVLGLASAAGVYGVYVATGRTSSAIVMGGVVVIAVAYFAQVLWSVAV